jgi:hypothetical protein
MVARMRESATPEMLAVRRRRESRRDEWTMQTKLAALLGRYCDPSCWWWTSLENKPLSLVSGLFQKRRGVRSGLPDVMVLLRRDAGTLVIFIELKSIRGRMSPAQKQVRVGMLPTGAVYVLARSSRAALMALHLLNVPFRREWKPPQIEPHEGPFFDPTQRLPAHPKVREERREAKRRYRLRREMREREAALAAARRIETDIPTSAPGDAPSRLGSFNPRPSAEIISFSEGKRP